MKVVVVQIGAILVIIEQDGRGYRIHRANQYNWLGGYLMGYNGFGRWKFYTSASVPQAFLNIEATLNDVIVWIRRSRIL